MQLQVIQQKIFEIRGQKVMLDFDLAALYEVETKVFNQAVKRNIESFPEDFMFKLTRKEWHDMRSQIVTSYQQDTENEEEKNRFITLCLYRTRRYHARQYPEKPNGKKNEYCYCESVYSIKKNREAIS